MKNKKDNQTVRSDEDNPEWTEAEIKQAHPALEVVSEIFGVSTGLRLRRGRAYKREPGQR